MVLLQDSKWPRVPAWLRQRERLGPGHPDPVSSIGAQASRAYWADIQLFWKNWLSSAGTGVLPRFHQEPNFGSSTGPSPPSPRPSVQLGLAVVSPHLNNSRDGPEFHSLYWTGLPEFFPSITAWQGDGGQQRMEALLQTSGRIREGRIGSWKISHITPSLANPDFCAFFR